MSNTDIMNNNIIDLKVGIDFAEVANNDVLKDYATKRINKIMADTDICQLLPLDIFIDSYVVDLVLFLKSSKILEDKESSDYFKGRLLDIVNQFPYLREKEDIKELL